jgi:hypothetical protein
LPITSDEAVGTNLPRDYVTEAPQAAKAVGRRRGKVFCSPQYSFYRTASRR